MYSELYNLTEGMATYEQFLDIEKAYMAKEKMTKQQAAALWKRRYAPKVEKPLPKYMQAFKSAIRDIKWNRDIARSKSREIRASNDKRIRDYAAGHKLDKDYCTDDAWTNMNISRMLHERDMEIYNMYEEMGGDSTFHIIYQDGSELIYSGTEIVCGTNPKLQNIAYAYYIDGWVEYDTLTGGLEWDWEDGDETGNEWFERREAYMNMVQYKYNTEWAKRMVLKYGEEVRTA